VGGVNLFACLVYDDGRSTPLAEVEFPDEDGPGLVTIQSVENGTVDAVEIRDETGLVHVTTYVGMFLRVTDSLQVTVMMPEHGGAITGATAYFLKEAEEAAVAEMREKLMGLADRLHTHQAPLWVHRGLLDMPTGDYL
jgi:hypothetical protein